ncbi:DUF1326 domain-containing protein [Saccharospirillum salsuginis]|uniref:DUF1326 domain-containing protein n=1 Tax=Saccharospirillum salsuginis TaxID=418750 RepID=A0A918NAC3_9GAMM|nr:DUF1326 domain-containing protein [Saccharospirillum salsuginis]GGX52862.1 hypothetical protein GCM10007392_20370 [Saccharospirillum salsuginis]
MSTEWTINGDYLESCSCQGACPCVYMGTPTEGDCTALVGWHIATGRFGDVPLDGLNVAVALNSPGAMADGNWKAVLYLDQNANEAQQEALGAIFGGQAGGHPAMLASLIGEVRGVEPMPIDYTIEQGKRHLKLGQSAEAEVYAIEGQDGQDVTIENHPLAVAPGETLVVASSRALRHQAHGIHLDLSERTAFYSPFSYAGP